MNLFDMLFSSAMIGGGGGGGDQMRTAAVSILYDADEFDETRVYAPFLSNDKTYISSYWPLDGGVPATIDVILGDTGTVILAGDDTYFSAKTGDVTLNNNTAFVVGDCTLTLSKGTPK